MLESPFRLTGRVTVVCNQGYLQSFRLGKRGGACIQKLLLIDANLLHVSL